VTDVDDLILNTLGSLLGYVLVVGPRGRRGLPQGRPEKTKTDQEVVA